MVMDRQILSRTGSIGTEAIRTESTRIIRTMTTRTEGMAAAQKEPAMM